MRLLLSSFTARTLARQIISVLPRIDTSNGIFTFSFFCLLLLLANYHRVPMICKLHAFFKPLLAQTRRDILLHNNNTRRGEHNNPTHLYQAAQLLYLYTLCTFYMLILVAFTKQSSKVRVSRAHLVWRTAASSSLSQTIYL